MSAGRYRDENDRYKSTSPSKHSRTQGTCMSAGRYRDENDRYKSTSRCVVLTLFLVRLRGSWEILMHQNYTNINGRPGLGVKHWTTEHSVVDSPP